jgi:hypothetical protein
MLSADENNRYWENAMTPRSIRHTEVVTPVVVPSTGTPLPQDSQTASMPVRIDPFKNALVPQHYVLRDEFEKVLLSYMADSSYAAKHDQLLDDLMGVIRKVSEI